MNKETLVAIFLGLSLGLIVTYGVYRSRSAVTSDQAASLTATPTPNPGEGIVSNLVVHSPVDESIVNEEAVTVAGTTDANAFIVIFINDEENITTADQSGNFSVSGTLESGSNVITVHSINEDGEKTVKEIVVVYTTQSTDDQAEDATEPKEEN